MFVRRFLEDSRRNHSTITPNSTHRLSRASRSLEHWPRILILKFQGIDFKCPGSLASSNFNSSSIVKVVNHLHQGSSSLTPNTIVNSHLAVGSVASLGLSPFRSLVSAADAACGIQTRTFLGLNASVGCSTFPLWAAKPWAATLRLPCDSSFDPLKSTVSHFLPFLQYSFSSFSLSLPPLNISPLSCLIHSSALSPSKRWATVQQKSLALTRAPAALQPLLPSHSPPHLKSPPIQ